MDDFSRKRRPSRFGSRFNHPHIQENTAKHAGAVASQPPHGSTGAASAGAGTAFKTPDQTAHEDVLQSQAGFIGSKELHEPVAPKAAGALAVAGASSHAASGSGAKSPKNILAKVAAALRIKKPTTPKEWGILGGVLLVILALLIGASYSLFFHKKPVEVVKNEPVAVAEAKPAEPTTVQSKLTGMPVDKAVNDRPVLAVMIENSQEARPQSGLKDAGIVFEAIAEGGITRFMTLWQDTKSDYIGPIRSVRPYYLDWMMPFDASIAHVGGAPQALSDIKSLKLKDLDQFYNAGPYTRVSNRYAPHNVYSSTDKLADLMKSKGFTSANFTGFAHKDKETPVQAPNAKSIDLNISSFLYSVHYDYDSGTNSYKRSEAGQAHKDEKSGQQLSPKVVVAVVMQRGIASDGQHTDYSTSGSGKMYVFQDGTAIEGTWSKASRQAQWEFKDNSGGVLQLNPGQAWISMVDTPGSITYK